MAGAEGAGNGVLRISLSAIRANYRTIAAHVAPSRCGAVLKADAYRLGINRVAPALYAAGCRDFFVALLSEALALKPLLPDDAAIHVLHGIMPGSESLCAAAGIRPALNSLDQAVAWAERSGAAATGIGAALQIDTGMSRMGLPADELQVLKANPELIARLDIKLVMSHLAVADEPEHPGNALQLAAFRAAAQDLPEAPRSLANSAGIFLSPSYHFDLCRPGAALYGLVVSPKMPRLRPAVGVYGRIVQLRTVSPGAMVGYGWTFRARRNTRVATVSVGYADGFLRFASDRSAIWLGEHRLRVIGRVSMDSLTVDATDVPPDKIRPGAYVEILGPHQSAEDLASDAGTINYEILTSLGMRYRRIYVD
ncbi:alanine racemase [Ochrobactrum vermis]|uniref:Alanine racemase n=1 Tax=Ochrobactrum vermis TaxID=1827297 RepID=A0ABU8PMS5_9HYPH|nr:alanine racemase [Ochrobactrum vermis]PQZ24505.1 alanine racemase [Ochrobactrum vermis]